MGGRVTALVTLVTANVVIGVKQLKYFSPYIFMQHSGSKSLACIVAFLCLPYNAITDITVT